MTDINTPFLHECQWPEIIREAEEIDFELFMHDNSGDEEEFKLESSRFKKFKYDPMNKKFLAICSLTKEQMGLCQIRCDAKLLVVVKIFVHKKWRNRGIARRLLRKAIFQSRLTWPNHLVVVNDVPISGMGFFQRFGFIDMANSQFLVLPVKETIKEILTEDFSEAELFKKYPETPIILMEWLNEMEKRRSIPFLLLIQHHTLISRYFEGSPLLSGLVSCAVEIEGGKMNLTTSKRLDYFNSLSDSILNTGHYAEIEDKWRLFYAYVSACLASLHYVNGNFKDALKECDYGLLKGNDLEDDSLARFATYLCREKLPILSIPSNSAPMKEFSCPTPLSTSMKIPVLQLPSSETFYNDFYSKLKPLIIRNLVDQWPAFSKWSFDYLVELCGHRIVPVEIGSKYTDEDWRQTLMTFYEYVTTYIFRPKAGMNNENPSEPGYLAQHRLLDQIPELCEDIIIPDYCAFGSDLNNDENSTFNVFIGPSGSISPLHTDPRHNFFCQIRGRKFVRLINPKYKEKLYLFEDMLRRNSSQINVEDPDLNEFPLFADVPCEDFVVEEGDCLFIPKGYFHHVRALTESISLSIWFGEAGGTSLDDGHTIG